MSFPPGSPVRGISPWVALPIKGERSGLTRLFSLLASCLPFLLSSQSESGEYVFSIFGAIGNACRLLTAMGCRSPCGYLVRALHGGCLCAPPFGSRVVGLPLRGFLLPPFPLVRPCRARLPLAGSALVGPPLALPSRGAGGPLRLFVPLFRRFGVSVLLPS